jgi:hypothetical protein
MGTIRRLKWRRWLGAVSCVVALLAGATAAFAHVHNHVNISLHPSSGKLGTVYTIDITGHVTIKQESLALAMTLAPGRCPSSYSGGFSKLGGIANAAGKPIGPKFAKLGKLDQTIRARITISQPGAYGICAYLTVGSDTKAHDGTTFRITS